MRGKWPARPFEWRAAAPAPAPTGDGVRPENYAGLVAKYHTSKIRQFDDIWGVQSFGFR